MRLPRVILVALSLLVLYLLLWPVPVDPVAWEAPRDRGLVAPFAPNDSLAAASLIDLHSHEGPEDAAVDSDGLIYATTAGGRIIRLHAGVDRPEMFAHTGGRPLGIEFDADGNLIVANAHAGIQRVSPDGRVVTILSAVDGERLAYADDVAVGRDGSIYFSDASSKFGAAEYGGTYGASLLDIMEHGGHGRIIRFDPKTRETTILMADLNFANGVAVSDDQQFLLVSETAAYRIWRHWLHGPDAGTSEIILDNLPGFPDNINNGLDGRFWVGLIAPRNELLDSASGLPWLRRVVQRLPAFLRPKATRSAHVIAITADGDVQMNLQDTAAPVPALTGVLETPDALYLTTLFGNQLPVLAKSALVDQP